MLTLLIFMLFDVISLRFDAFATRALPPLPFTLRCRRRCRRHAMLLMP